MFLEDTNRAADVFIRDLASSTTTLVSVNLSGTGTANRGSELLTMTPDGRFIAFWSDATDVSADVTNTTGEVYVRDMRAGVTYCLTKDMRISYVRRFDIALTPDGRYAAVQELNDPGPPGGLPSPGGAGSVILADVFSGTITNVFCCGRPGRGLAISGDGSRIVFYGRNFEINKDVFYLRDTSLSTNSVLVTNAVDIESFQMSQDFRQLWYTLLITNRGYQLFRYVTGQTNLASTNSLGLPINAAVLSPFSLSGDGDIVAFETAADDLGPVDQNRAPDVFLSGNSLLAPRHPNLPEGTSYGLATLNRATLSADGRRIAFAAADGSLVANDTNKTYDVFLADLKSNIVINPGTVIRSTNVIATVISADGGSLLFQRLAGDEFRGAYELDRADLRTGQIQRISPGVFLSRTESLLSQDGRWMVRDGGHIWISDLRTPTLSGQISNQLVDVRLNSTVVGNGLSFNPTISLDGEWVAFLSTATDLTTNTGFPSNVPQAFARNIRQGRTRLLSIDAAGNPLSGGATNVALSANARYASYQTYIGTNIYRHDLSGSGPAANALVCANGSGASMSGDGQLVGYQSQGQIYVRDMQAAVTETIGGDQARDATISLDGRFVAYVTKPAGISQIYLRDRRTATTHLISRNYLGTGPGNGPSSMPVMSHDGRTLAFQSFASDLVPGDYNGRRDIFVVQITAVDTDGDGMDDDWEMHYFGTLDRDGSGNFDGDHETDREEYLAGTDPTDPASSVHLTNIRSTTYGPVFDREVSWSSAPGKTYRLQHRVTLLEPWTDLSGDITTGGPRGTASHLEHHDWAPRTGFYRVQLVE